MESNINFRPCYVAQYDFTYGQAGHTDSRKINIVSV